MRLSSRRRSSGKLQYIPSFSRSRSTELDESLLKNPMMHGEVAMNTITSDHASSTSSLRSPNLTDAELKAEMVDEGYRWDFCIVAPNPDHSEFKATARNFDDFVSVAELLERLHTAGLQTYQFTSTDGDEVFIKIRAPLKVLCYHAQRIKFKFKIDKNFLQDYIEDPDARIGETEFSGINYSPYEFIFGEFCSEKRDIYAKAPNLKHPFGSAVRVKILYAIINGTDSHCCSLNLRKLRDADGKSICCSLNLCKLRDADGKSINSFFPLHDHEQRDELARNWFNWRVHPWEQPIDDVKDYLGEKVALYFEFTGHYTTWLVPLVGMGLVVALYMAIDAGLTSNFNDALQRGIIIPFYCIFVSCWAQLMLEFWKRKEARKAMEWGMSDFEDEELERPEFFSDGDTLVHSIVDGSLQKYFPPAKRSSIIAFSNFILASMVLLVIGCVSAVFYLQFYFTQSDDDSERSSGSTGISILSAVQIIVLNMVYTRIAIDRTDKENYRTDTEYDDALIAKLFCFSFVNSYASLYYIAFVKTNIGAACQGACMVELAYQLTIVFATQMTVAKITSWLTMKMNLVMSQYNEYREHQIAMEEHRHLRAPSAIELENLFNDYDPSLDVLQDYAQIVVQYGYVTLFVSANPLAPLLAYLSNWIEVRLDGWKLLYMTKRVLPTGAQDIGTWQVILQLISIAAVITNAGIVCFTMKILSFGDVDNLWIFVGFQYSILIAMGLFAYIVDDVPIEVETQLKRQTFFAERALLSAEQLEAKNNPQRIRPRQAHLDVEKLKIKSHDEDYDPKKANAESGGVEAPPCTCLISCLLGHSSCSCCKSRGVHTG